MPQSPRKPTAHNRPTMTHMIAMRIQSQVIPASPIGINLPESSQPMTFCIPCYTILTHSDTRLSLSTHNHVLLPLPPPYPVAPANTSMCLMHSPLYTRSGIQREFGGYTSPPILSTRNGLYGCTTRVRDVNGLKTTVKLRIVESVTCK
jgi:hypothetical protein